MLIFVLEDIIAMSHRRLLLGAIDSVDVSRSTLD